MATGADDLHQFTIASLLHQRHDTPYGMHSERVSPHRGGRLGTQLEEQTTLDRTVEHRFARCSQRYLGSRSGLSDRRRRLFEIEIRTAEYIEHRGDVDANIPLEFDDFFRTYFHLAVDITLEGA